MKFDDLNDMEVNDSDLQERLSSWRHMSGVTKQLPNYLGEQGFNEAQVRSRQRHIAAMCLETVKAHDAFYNELKAFLDRGGRDPNQQQRAEDEAAFALGVFEQMSAKALEMGIIHELDNLPKEVNGDHPRAG
jgi:hypothetical protein